ncbi:NUDIX hydrolase [Amphritea balenae]|uniref:NUDIX hydrolase n=1 Tax=Amphritea balenae TaxID=452629 RepID=A0A3P1SMX6_9GAMM|nr:NUDIX hydrolase [Amphritea balenae]RRC98516.1 NUDIX hydrolase [Amphritea balenae]GGK65197.1 NUDIX hydrolase [Amphritea balenae]
MNFCSQCGASIKLAIPEGDNRQRHICTSCHHIHYLNPKIVAGCLPVWQDKVLLCKRSIEPRSGYWTLPAGFMENGESTRHAALRETREEANARVSNLQLYTLTSMAPVSQVQMIYLAQLDDLDFSAGDETEAVALYSEEEIPWDDLAFQTIHNALKLFFEDRKKGIFPLHHIDLERPSKPPEN